MSNLSEMPVFAFAQTGLFRPTKLSLKFDAFGLANFYNGTDLTLDKTKCLKEIETRSSKKKRAIQTEEIELKVADIRDYYNLYNRHDAVKALALHIAAVNGGKGIKAHSY